MLDTPPHPVDPDLYRSIADGPEVEARVKGSRFLARALAIRDEPEAIRRLEGIREQHRGATHHCWAFRAGPPDHARERHDDDGEPSGSAGVPIMRAIHRERLHDTLVVVTRWFGGVKLGVGGLARAYGDSAREALAAAPSRPVWRTIALDVSCAFEEIGTIEAAIQKAGDAVRDVDRRFDPAPHLRLAIRRSRAEAVRSAILDATAGRARVAIAANGEGE